MPLKVKVIGIVNPITLNEVSEGEERYSSTF